MSSNEIFMLPTAHNFSEMEHGEDSYDLPYYEIDWSEVFIEETIISMLKELDNDRERVIFLLMAMSKDGYDFKHKDIATMFRIDYSWYMRLVRGIKHQLSPFLHNNLSKSREKAVKTDEKTQNNTKTV